MAVGYLASNTGCISGENLAGNAIMGMSGNNLGNLAFWHAAQLLFDETTEVFDWNVDIERVRPLISHFVIPAANFLNPAWDLQVLCDIVTKLDKQCVVFGLGAQSTSEDIFPKLQDGTIAFLRAISERSKTIFVRGEFTAEVCRRYGVENVTPIGCPSFMISTDRSLGQHINSQIGKEMVNFYSAGGTFSPSTNEVERQLFSLVCTSPDGMYVIQDPASLIDLISGFGVIDPLDRRLNTALEVLGGKMGVGWAAQALQQHGRYFLGITEWLQAASSCNYAISTRIHGAILPLMAGVPSVIVGHDARVRELAGMLQIPIINPARIERALVDVPTFFQEIDFNGISFDVNRAKLALLYVNHLSAAGLSPSSHLKNICYVEDNILSYD